MPDTAVLQAKLLDSMREGVAKFLPGIGPDGRVELDGQWTTFHQGCGLLLAAVLDAESERPDANELSEKLNRAVGHFCSLVADDGQVPFSTAYGNWGRYVPCWEFSGHMWLLRHYSHLLTPQTASAVREALVRLSRGLAKNLPSERLHNIQCFGAAALWQAGVTFGERAWSTTARDYLARIAAVLTPDGYWMEHAGPTTLYNLVYTHAAGIHHWEHGETPVGDALRRAGAFHSRFVYPDGSLVSLIDGRVLYGGQALASLGLPGLLQSESGAGYISTLAASPHRFPSPTSNGVTFHPQVYTMLRDGAGVSIPGAADRVPLADRVAVHRAGAFTVVLSALVGSVESRWGYDRHQHLEVHHPAAGVMVGGGLSRGPDMAFLCDGKEHVADSAEIEDAGRAVRLRYPWGEGVIRVEPGAAPAVTMEASGAGQLRMLLPVLPGWLEGAAKTARTNVTALTGKGLTVRVESAATLAWPVKPWYPYHKEGAAPEGMWRHALVWEGRDKVHARMTFEESK